MPKQVHVAPDPDAGAVDEEVDSRGTDRFEPVDARGPHLVPVDLLVTRIGRAEEVDEQMLVREPAGEAVRRHRSVTVWMATVCVRCAAAAHHHGRVVDEVPPSSADPSEVETEVLAEELDLPAPALGVLPETWGVMNRFGAAQSGLLGCSGSSVVTSNRGPRPPASRARTSASSSTEAAAPRSRGRRSAS